MRCAGEREGTSVMGETAERSNKKGEKVFF